MWQSTKKRNQLHTLNSGFILIPREISLRFYTIVVFFRGSMVLANWLREEKGTPIQPWSHTGLTSVEDTDELAIFSQTDFRFPFHKKLDATALFNYRYDESSSHRGEKRIRCKSSLSGIIGAIDSERHAGKFPLTSDGL
jgi:hypothetical protein